MLLSNPEKERQEWGSMEEREKARETHWTLNPDSTFPAGESDRFGFVEGSI